MGKLKDYNYLAEKKDINSNQAGYISLNDFMSRWQSSMNKPVFENKNVGDLVYEAFK